VVIGYDEAKVVIRPDRGQTAIDLWNVGALGWDAVRKANGFDEDDAMSKEEEDVWLAVKMREPTFVPSDVAPPLRGPTPATNGNVPAEQGPPPPTQDGTSRPDGQTASIMAAAEMALLRCRELAGSRILSYRDTCQDCLQPAQGVPKQLVASVLGPEVLKEIKAPDPLKLVQGGADGFRGWLTGHEVSDEQSAALGQMIEVYASKTLFEEKHTLPSGFAAHVERVKNLAVVN
jgi:hypothetical protein